jgi:hypothetical protein
VGIWGGLWYGMDGNGVKNMDGLDGYFRKEDTLMGCGGMDGGGPVRVEGKGKAKYTLHGVEMVLGTVFQRLSMAFLLVCAGIDERVSTCHRMFTAGP